MPWDNTKSDFQTLSDVPGDQKITSSEWNAHVTDQKARGYDTISTQTGNYTASTNEIVLGDASGGAITITLPDPTETGIVTIKKIDSSSNAVEIATPNSETIDGDSSRTVTGQYVAREIVCDGTNYYII